MVVAIDNLSFAYGKEPVIENLSFTIEPGETVVVLGPNGAGKTTLIELLLGFLKPNSGQVRTLGYDPRKAGSDFWRELGVVQQHWKDHPKWKVGEQLRWIASAHQSAGKKTKAVEEALSEVELLDFIDHPLGKLSGGQRRRADLAVAIMGNPKFLILDEPTTGLDPVARNCVHELIDRANLVGTTILMSTHDLAEAEKIASRIVIIKGGKIIADGTSDELRAGLDHRSEIRWRDVDGNRHVHVTDTPLPFVRELPETTQDLTVSRHTLEDSYLSLIGEK